VETCRAVCLFLCAQNECCIRRCNSLAVGRVSLAVQSHLFYVPVSLFVVLYCAYPSYYLFIYLHNSNSDIWRDFPNILKFFFNLIYLNNRQGCQTSVAAAVGEWDDKVIYLQPYWLPATSSTQVPFPVTEMLGVFQGHRVTQPRLPADGGLLAGQALWKAGEELTGAEWK
jgi:hypothetical protein